LTEFIGYYTVDDEVDESGRNPEPAVSATSSVDSFIV